MSNNKEFNGISTHLGEFIDHMITKIQDIDKHAGTNKREKRHIFVLDFIKTAINNHSEEVKDAPRFDDYDNAEIVRCHRDSYSSVRMGDFMYILCGDSVLIMNMETGRIVHKSDNEIIDMIRETSDVDEDTSDNSMMFDYCRDEYM